MPTVKRGSITVELPDSWQVESRRRAAPDADGELSSREVAEALGENFEQVDVLPLAPVGPAPAPTPTSGGRRRSSSARPEPEPATVTVPVAADENAVLLVEQDGVYAWVHGEVAASPRRARGAAVRTVTFELELVPATMVRRARTRGFKPTWLLKPIKVFVFKFVAGVAVGQLVKRFERDIETGLVWIRSSDPDTRWSSLRAGEPRPTLPKDRPGRVLLLVHGTFSSTEGGYGHFKATPAGRQFLDRAMAQYDAVVGLDHRTLSEDPLENAERLKEALEGMDGGKGIVVEAVTHSRGALVLRSLVEHLLAPGEAIQVRRAVLVAGPNAGTRLAAPDRWSDLVDLYTNLVVGASRLVSFLAPGSALATTIVSESTKGLAALVKAVTTAAVDASLAPGLAAMDPSGAFIEQLNRPQPNQPTPDQIWYAAVTTNYEPDLLDGPGRLPKRLGLAIADAAIDRLMGADNDLVVHVPSMTSVDLPQRYVKDVFDVPQSAATYHTTYFDAPSVIHRIGAWLSIDTVPSAPSIVPAGSTATALPPGGSDRVVVVDADTPREAVEGLVKVEDPEFAVVRRRTRGGALEHVAVDRDALDRSLRRMARDDVLSQVIGDRRRAATEIDVGSRLFRPRSPGDGPSPDQVVVVRGDLPVGVVPAEAPSRAAAPRPPRATARAKLGARRGGRPARKVVLETRVGAVMPDTVDVGDEDLLLVELSVDQLEAAVGPEAVEAVFKPSSDRNISVDAIAKSNASVVGEDHAEVEPPRTGEPRLLQFRVRGDAAGPGQVAVVVSQGAVVLVRLLLDFTVLEPRPAEAPSKVGAEPIMVSRLVERAEPMEPCDQLWIEETKVIGEVTVDGRDQRVTVETAFDVRYLSEQKEIEERGATGVIKGDRIAYVTELYRKIEADWRSSHGDVDMFHDAVKAYGAELFERLLPEKIQRVLWDNRNRIKTIQVRSDDPYIPWELLHLKDPDGGVPTEDRFLAQMGVVRWLDGAGVPPRSFRVRKGSRYVLAPEYPPGSGWELATATEAGFLEKKLGARAATPTWKGLRELIEKPGRFDLLHFAGHGIAPVGKVEQSGLVLQVTEDEAGDWAPWAVESTMIEQFAHLRSPSGSRPVVFLNACQVGRSGYQLTGVGGFAQAFLRGGAGAFVSCLWSVGDEPAIAFCRTFYGALLKGRTIAQAAHEARRKARADGDPTWLAYVVYGRPEATVTFS